MSSLCQNIFFCILLAWMTILVVGIHITWQQSLTLLLNINVNSFSNGAAAAAAAVPAVASAPPLRFNPFSLLYNHT